MDLASLPLIRPQRLVLAPRIVLYYRVRRVQYILRGAVILFQFDDCRLRIHLFEIKNIPDIRPSEFIDRLVIVAYHAKVPIFICQQADQFKLRRIGVLVFVHHQITKPILITGQHLRAGFEQFHRFHDQVVKIQRVAFPKRLLIFHVSPGDPFHMEIPHRLYLIILRGHQFVFCRRYRA